MSYPHHIKRRLHDERTLCGVRTFEITFIEFNLPVHLMEAADACEQCLAEAKNSAVDDALEKVPLDHAAVRG